MLQPQANIKKINDPRQADGEEHKISKEDDEPQLMGEARAAMRELFDMNTNPADTLSLEQRVAMLNTDQNINNGHPVFEKITQKLRQHKLGCATSVNIWRDVSHVKLTINERQKKDAKVSAMLDSVHCGCPTAETIGTFQERLVQGSIADKLIELWKHGQSPVCLFPRRKHAMTSTVICSVVDLRSTQVAMYR